METTTVEDSEDQENLKALWNFQIGMTQEGYLIELVSLLKLSIPKIKVCRRKTGTWSIKTRSFCQENPKAGDINYGMIAHGNDNGINMANHEVIAAYAIVTVLS